MFAKQTYWPRVTLLTANFTLPILTFAAGLPWSMMWACFVIHNLLGFALTAPWCNWLGPMVTRFQTEKKELWLTIDDGPDGQNSVALSEALRSRGVPATFFVIGRFLEGQSEVAAALLRAGHTLANHTFTHPLVSFWMLRPFQLRREIDATNDALRVAGAGAACWFRAPLGLKNIFLHPELRRRGMRQIIWSARGRDGLACDPATVVERVARSARPGAIVVLHERMPRSQETILQVVDAMQAQGYAFVIPAEAQLC